jgi:hypothetical protein
VATGRGRLRDIAFSVCQIAGTEHTNSITDVNNQHRGHRATERTEKGHIRIVFLCGLVCSKHNQNVLLLLVVLA